MDSWLSSGNMQHMREWEAEYEQLSTRCGAIRLTDWSQVVLAGADRAKFLHNMCTNDILRLEEGTCREAFCSDVKGKIQAHVLVIGLPERLILLTVPGQSQRIITHLDRYIIREDVELSDATNESSWRYMVGPAAKEFTAGLSNCVPCDLLWPGGYLVPGDVDIAAPAVPVESPAVAALRVESFWPIYGTDFDESHLPQEINRDARAISFTKGCYLGQETVARIDALGHVNKKLVQVKFSGDDVPARGSKLTHQSAEKGTVVSSCWSPRHGAPLALAFVRREASDVGTVLECDQQGAEVVGPST